MYGYYISDTVVIPRELFRNNKNERVLYENSKCSTFVQKLVAGNHYINILCLLNIPCVKEFVSTIFNY